MNYVGALICACAPAAAAAALYGPQGGAERRIYAADGPYLYPGTTPERIVFRSDGNGLDPERSGTGARPECYQDY